VPAGVHASVVKRAEHKKSSMAIMLTISPNSQKCSSMPSSSFPKPGCDPCSSVVDFASTKQHTNTLVKREGKPETFCIALFTQ
jgi:hypothetical protein